MNFFHLLNRGVEKRNIFSDFDDYSRFVHNFFDFNDENNTLLPFYQRRKENEISTSSKQPIVHILTWCLMPNHFHIFAEEKKEGGVSSFTKKVTGGYTQHFNLKNKRTGVLFQGKTKIISISKDKHFLYLPYYILSNPIKLIQSDWQEVGIKNIDKTLKFLKEYKWSSLYEIITGSGLYPKITNTEYLFGALGAKNKTKFIKDFESWLSAMR
ncbi:MAG: transposase [Patescibacteria group bacterium]